MCALLGSSLGMAGCACGPVGTLAARRTLTPTAEVLDVYAIGLWARASAVDTGLSCGWRRVTFIQPRKAGAAAEVGSRWTFGYAAMPRETPFFFGASDIGAGVSRYPGFVRAHAGYAVDTFTFAAAAEESRVVSFHYRPAAPAATRLAIAPLPSASHP